MPDGDVEKKKIANLTFDVDLSQLKEVNTVLDSIDKKVAQMTNKNSLNIKINTDKAIDIDGLQQQYTKLENLDQKSLNELEKNRRKQVDNTSAYVIKSATKENSEIDILRQKNINNANQHDRKMTEIAERGNQERLTSHQKFQQKLELQNQKQLKSTKSLYDQISSYAKTYLAYQGLDALARGARELINEMVEIESQMNSIDRVLGDSSLNINTYRDQLIQLAYDYGNTFDAVSDATLRLAQAGFSAEESLQLTEKTLLALNTAELDATQATDDMVAIMAQWGVTSADTAEKSQFYGETIDKINKVADKFPTSSADILDALKKTSSAFNLAGASIDETIAMITTAEIASQRGGKAIGTAMSNIVQQLKDEGRLNTMEDLGIEIYTDETKQEFNSVIDIITQLSEKMQELQAAGQENSVEMQELLTVFTVFRRNIGAGLLSGVAGEESTYNEVLKTSINSLGYSMEENAKYMQTAKAAQAQFNAELLKLKTDVWDGGLEDVFRTMLELGTDLINGIRSLIDTFGVIPSSIGVATLAFTAFNKQLQVVKFDTETNSIKLSGLFKKIADGTKEVRKTNTAFKEMQDGQIAFTGVMGKNNTAWLQNIKATGQYAGKLATTTLRTIGLEAATIALNAALSLGLSLAITAVISLFDNLIHAEEKYIENIEKEKEAVQENIDKTKEEKDTLEQLANEYQELSEKENRTPEENQKIYELQLQINSVLGEQGKNIEFNNLSYEEQLTKLKEITAEQQEQLENDAKRKLQLAEQGKIGVSFDIMDAQNFWGISDQVLNELEDAGVNLDSMKPIGGTYDQLGFANAFNNLNFDEQLDKLTEWEEALRNAGKTGTDAYSWVSESLQTLQDRQDDVTEATNEYYNVMAESMLDEYFPEDSIENVEQYKEALDSLSEWEVPEEFEGFKDTFTSLFKERFSDLGTELEVLEGDFEAVSEVIGNNIEELTSLSNSYATLKEAQEQYNTTGTFTADMFNQLIANGGELLQYLSFENGQLQINTQAMLNLAESKKVAAIQSLQAASAEDIQKAAMGDLEGMSNIAKGAVSQFGDNATTAGNQSLTASQAVANLAASMQAAYDAAKGNLGEGVDTATFERNANAIMSAYKNVANSIANIKITAPTYNPQIATGFSGSGGSGSGGSSSSAKKAAEEAKKAEEEAYNERLDKYKDYIDDLEEEEQRWVDKQQELGQLSSEDMQYITQQRIKRYQKYLDQVKKMTWLSKEDRLELEKEYTQEIEDLQLEYMGYLKDALDEEIDAIQEANEKKIEAIEEEADKQIEALQKVEDERDRIRDKEDYENQRKEIEEEIAYWEQRTGREAQENLKEAKENLEELDEEWEDQLEDWSIEDQIAKIEEQRDAQIAAIEEAEEKEIAALQKIYDQKVKLFSETGKIIYDNGVIQSKKLYSAYKKNFVDPITSDLNKLYKSTSSKSSSSSKKYESYKVKYGDTLSGIAAKFDTTVSKIMDANSSIKNKNLIYAGSTLKIPKFHEGGIVGGTQEAFALLKPNEVILKTEWAASLNRMMKYFDNLTTGNATNITNGPTIEVSGNLVNIEANIKNKSDINYLERRIERMLNDKFNIKK